MKPSQSRFLRGLAISRWLIEVLEALRGGITLPSRSRIVMYMAPPLPNALAAGLGLRLAGGAPAPEQSSVPQQNSVIKVLSTRTGAHVAPWAMRTLPPQSLSVGTTGVRTITWHPLSNGGTSKKMVDWPLSSTGYPWSRSCAVS